MNLYVGTSGYSYPKWKGKFYPKGLPTEQMLRHYAEHFRAVEINSTFYAMPKAATLETWLAEVPKGFKFPLKAPQQITHRSRLKDAADSVRHFIEVAASLGEHLGPLLFQLPPNFKKDIPRLSDFLDLIPSGTRITFEFRHLSWFDDETFDLLRKHHAALCIAEDDDLQTPFVATADWGYLRLRRADYGDAQLKDSVKQIKKQDWTDAYVFFKHEDTGTGPRFAKSFLEIAKSAPA